MYHVKGTNAGSIMGTACELSVASGHGVFHLCKDDHQAGLSKKRGLSTHVWPSKKKHIWCQWILVFQVRWRRSQRRVIRDVLPALVCLRETGMSRILEANERRSLSVIELGSREARARRDFRQGQKHIEMRQAADSTSP